MTALDTSTTRGPSRATAPPAHGTGRWSRRSWSRRAPLLPALVFAVIVTQLPFLLTVWYSLQSWNLVRPGSQHFVGLSNYVDVFSDSVFRGAALNTVVITGSCVAVSMLLGIGLALLLDRRFVGRGVVRTLLVTPFLVMPVASALLWKTTMFDPVFGIVNFVLSPFGVEGVDWVTAYPVTSVVTALVWQWTPFMMLLVLAGLQAQSREVLEAAQVDGATGWRTFTSITLPHLRRYIELGVLLGAIYVVNTFDQIYMMTQGGPGTVSANLPFYIYQRAFLGFDVGQAAAMGVVVVVGTIVVATVALRLIFTSFFKEES
jgi:sorbitol/mannitol transport system permease protein